MTVSFRLAKADQLHDIRTLFSEAMAPIAGRMGIEQPSDAFSDLSRFLETRNLYVVVKDDLLVGSLAMHETDDGLYIDYLAIHKDHQNQGLGSRILAEAEFVAESRELSRLQLHTPDVMTELHVFYQKHGFVETCKALPTHGRDDILRIHFEKPVSRQRSACRSRA